MNANEKTLLAYEEDPQGYIDKTPVGVQGDKKAWIDAALSKLPKNPEILELGSGFGRDADYIEGLGYPVQRSEAAQSFIRIMAEQGHKALRINAITDDFGGPYDLIYANAVLVHFTPAETRKVIAKVYQALKPGGLFACRTKGGNGFEWENSMKMPRVMEYWDPNELEIEFDRAGFEVMANDLGHSSFNKSNWIQIIARKATRK